MPDNLVITYRLQSSTQPSRYEAWVKESDLPFVISRSTVLGYTCQRVSPQQPGIVAPFDYLETLTVTDVREDAALDESERGKQLTQEWLGMVVDPVVLQTNVVASYFRRGHAVG